MTNIRKSYTISQKLKIVAYAADHSRKDTAMNFGIHKSIVSRWVANKLTLQQAPSRARKLGSGPKPQFPVEERRLYERVCQKRQCGYAISCSQLQSKMRKLVHNTRFQASTGWLYGFLRRYKLSLRVCTTPIRKTDASVPNKDDTATFSGFLEYVDETVRERNVTCIWNMDETPLLLDMPMKRSIEVKGKKCVPYVNTGNERKRVSVILCVSEYGQKMIPMLVVSDNHRFEQGTCINGLTAFKQKNTFMTGSLTVEWLNRIFLHESCTGQLPNGKRLLVLDSFSGHISSVFKERINEIGLSTAVIPGGCTKDLQPLDIGVNRSFKSHFRHLWDQWIQRPDLPCTATGKVRAINMHDIAELVRIAWDKVPTECIFNSFQAAKLSTCGRSTAEIIDLS
jgi:hypothetical protein